VEQGWIGQRTEIYAGWSIATVIKLLDGLEVCVDNRPVQAQADGLVERGVMPGIDCIAPCHSFNPD
jgi:hypothetical protein